MAMPRGGNEYEFTIIYNAPMDFCRQKYFILTTDWLDKTLPVSIIDEDIALQYLTKCRKIKGCKMSGGGKYCRFCTYEMKILPESAELWNN